MNDAREAQDAPKLGQRPTSPSTARDRNPQTTPESLHPHAEPPSPADQAVENERRALERGEESPT